MEKCISPHTNTRGEEEAPSISLTTKKREQKESREDESSDLASKRHKYNQDTQGIVCTSEQLFDQTQSLVAEINAKRKNDSVLLADFKKVLDLNVESFSAAIERAMFHNYSVTGDIMQAKLQDLYETLDRISKLEQELVRFKEALGMLYSDITSN